MSRALHKPKKRLSEASPERKNISQLQRDLNRTIHCCTMYLKKIKVYKNWIKQANLLFEKLKKEKRITKEELSKYFRQRKEVLNG